MQFQVAITFSKKAVYFSKINIIVICAAVTIIERNNKDKTDKHGLNLNLRKIM